MVIMTTSFDRKTIIDAGLEHGWSVSYGWTSLNVVRFRKDGTSRYLDVYLSGDGTRILEAHCPRGAVEPDMTHLMDYLTRV